MLVIDEVGYLSYGPDAANVLFHVVNERYLHHRPMIFTTNKPLAAWGRVLHDPDLAQAILDRVLERGRHLELRGASYRTRHVKLDLNHEPEPSSSAPARISGNHRPQFPEPTGVSAYFEQFGSAMPKTHKKVIGAITDCHTEAAGSTLTCARRVASGTCSIACAVIGHCPRCQQGKGRTWLERHRARQLPGEHFLGTFTVPELRRPFLRWHQTTGYGALFAASAGAIKTLAVDPHHIGADVPGFFGILHTWAAPCGITPPFHYVVVGGALSREDGCWHPARPGFYLPVRVRTMTLPVMEFMRLFLQHALPRGFMKVRYYCFLSPSASVPLEAVKTRVEMASGFALATPEAPSEPLRAREDERPTSCAAHAFVIEGGGRILDESDMVAELHAEASGGFDAGIRHEADEDDLLDPPLCELGVEVGIGEATLSPVLEHDDNAKAGAEFGMELSGPASGGEAAALVRPNLGRVHVLPPKIVAVSPSPMGHTITTCIRAARIAGISVRMLL